MARRVTRFVRPPKKTVMWIGMSSLAGGTVVAAGTSVLLTTLSAGALLLRPFTVMRSRGVIRWISDQSGAAESSSGAYGRVVVTDSASAAGVAAIPTPTGEPEASWFVYQPLIQEFTFVSGVGIALAEGSSSYWSFDSKSMRKVGIDDDVVGIISNRNGTNGSLVEVVGRQLIQLH